MPAYIRPSNPPAIALISLAVLLSTLLPFRDSLAQTNGPNSSAALNFASNVVNSTMTGAALGAATLGLQNSTDYAPPLRVGVGLGILAGIGLATWDMIGQPVGSEILRKGTFISGNNTSVIILVDTFYGSAAGALVGTAVTLVANEPFLDGLQYGFSAGALAGFGFGLVDVFLLNNRFAKSYADPSAASASGSRLAFLQPDLAIIPTAGSHGISRQPAPVLQVVSLDIRF